MKIRTIVGILLVLALVLGSTGVATAADPQGEKNKHGGDQGHGGDCPYVDCPDGVCPNGVCPNVD